MILFTILLCTIIAIAVITGLVVVTGGSMFMILAADLIVCIWIIWSLCKKKKRS